MNIETSITKVLLKTSIISLENYFYKSVHNKFIDQYRKGKAVMALEKKYIEALELAVEEQDELQEQKILGILFNAIYKLPHKCQQIFLMSKKEGLTNIEIYEVIMMVVFGSETKRLI